MKKISKVLAGLGSVVAIVTPVTALSMTTEVASNVIVMPKQRLFDNVYSKQLAVTKTWKSDLDDVRLVYENKDEMQHIENLFDFYRAEGYIAPPEVEKDFKVTVLGASADIYRPGDTEFDYNPRILVDVEYLKTGKHWGFSMDSTSNYSSGYTDYDKVVSYLYRLVRLNSKTVIEAGKDSNTYKNAYKSFQKAYAALVPVFFNNEQNYFKGMKDLILSVQNKGQSLNSKISELGIERTMDTYQLFNRQNILNFKKNIDTKKVVMDDHTFRFNTRTTGIIDPRDMVQSKELYKQDLIAKLKANKVTLDPAKIDTYNDINVKIKKVVLIPEFELRGDWDIHYKGEISGSLFNKPLLIQQQEIKQLGKTDNTYTQDLYAHLLDVAKKVGITTDRSKLYPLQNVYKNYDEYKNSLTQKLMPELFKGATFSANQDFDISKFNNDLYLDLTIQNTITHDPTKKFEIHFTDIAVGFQYEAELNKDITIPGVKLLLK